MIRAAWQGVVAGRAVWWAPAFVAAIASTLLGLCLVQTSSTDLPEARTVILASGIVPWAAHRAQLPVRLVLPWAELSIAAGITLAVVLAALLVPARRALRASVRETLASL